MCRESVLVSCSPVCRALLSVPMGVLTRLSVCLQRFGVPCVGFSFLCLLVCRVSLGVPCVIVCVCQSQLACAVCLFELNARVQLLS